MGKYQPFLNLEGVRFDELVKDIERNGVLIPIIVDEHGEVIDGHQRRRACAELHIECPRHVVEGLTEQEKGTLAVTLNLFRRQLSGAERGKAMAELVRLGMSTRRIADILGMSKSAAARAVAEVDDRPETVTGTDGRQQPAVRTPASTAPNGAVPPEGVDANGEIEAGGTSTREDEDTDPAGSPAAEDGGVTPPASSPAGTRVPADPESIEERNAREAEQRRVDRNVDFGKFLIGMWAMFRGERSAALFLDGWVPDECPQWQVDPHKPLFTADGIRDVAHLLEKLATEWESRV